MAEKKWFTVAAITAAVSGAVALVLKKIKGGPSSSEDPEDLGSEAGSSSEEEE